MKQLFTVLNIILTQSSLGLIWLYQKTLSPDEWPLRYILRGKVCAHEPHCSEYARLSLVRYGFLDSIEAIINRIISCRPSMTKTYDPVSYRVVFASSAPIGASFLQAITQDSRFDVVWVVTQPDQPVGRGLKMQANIIKTEAQKLNRNTDFIATPDSLRLVSKKYPEQWAQFQSWLESKQPDFLVVIAYGNIIPQHILDVPTIAPVNVHGSLLPLYRGASPIQSVLLDDQPETGITIMRMDAGLDTGPMLRAQGFPLTIHMTAHNIISKFQEFWPQLLIDTMIDYAKGKVLEIIQDDSLATYCNKLDKTAGLVSPWTQSLEEINNIYRACILWPKTYFILDESRGKHAGKQIIIDSIELDDKLRKTHKSQPLFAADQSKHHINKAITNLLVKPEWAKTMSREDWLRGL